MVKDGGFCFDSCNGSDREYELQERKKDIYIFVYTE